MYFQIYPVALSVNRPFAYVPWPAVGDVFGSYVALIPVGLAGVCPLYKHLNTS